VPWNVLILPLLAGYLYCTRCNKVWFEYRQADGNRLLLASALYGVVFLLLATGVIVIAGPLAGRVSWLGETTRFWMSHNPYPHLGKSLASLGLSCLVTLAFNKLFNRDKEKYRVLEEELEVFEQLLQRAVDTTHPLLLSLNNQKAYVAFSLDKVRIDRKYLKVLPLWSGYRKSDTQEVVFTTDYTKVYDELGELVEDSDIDARLEDFALVIPAEFVVSATLFDMQLYSEHFSVPEKPVATPSGVDGERKPSPTTASERK
jgi:hypothetical protein